MPSSTPAEPMVEEDRVCPECGSEHLVRDYARGELVCDSCGLVVSESAIDEGPEWAAYSVEENDRLARTGAPRSYVAGSSGLTTVIPLANKDARGNTIPLREREKFYRASSNVTPATPARGSEAYRRRFGPWTASRR